MYVEVAIIDAYGWRSEIMEFHGVETFDHERGCQENDWTDTVYLSLKNGVEPNVTDKVTGNGYGIDIVCAEEE